MAKPIPNMTTSKLAIIGALGLTFGVPIAILLITGALVVGAVVVVGIGLVCYEARWLVSDHRAANRRRYRPNRDGTRQ